LDFKKKKREALKEWALAHVKANKSRDKNLVRKLAILEKEVDKLRIKVDKTIDPALEQEADEAYQRFRKIYSLPRIANRKKPK